MLPVNWKHIWQAKQKYFCLDENNYINSKVFQCTNFPQNLSFFVIRFATLRNWILMVVLQRYFRNWGKRSIFWYIFSVPFATKKVVSADSSTKFTCCFSPPRKYYSWNYKRIFSGIFIHYTEKTTKSWENTRVLTN